ncbi:DUF305 domain-containing protein [Alterinioella nitratireducens]|uniref:DUF305 domain-containing protein n=1 Tax=Alterinioella nitratireducens TaxID=2735915 RepID=UPI00155760F1|nr:DUF305 domain-containing protein [Alterinioella nitratireducens]NPD18775.1 DUF305 domain-containing protein [Alterinioella nitratireducens]
MTYTRFIAMILTSTVTMFGLMYLNTFVWSHVQFSETRTYMAIYMGATMAVIMLLFMWGMYRNKASNYAILGVSVVVFAASLYLLRSQATVGDISWMRAMIPHHSIAILTSERATLSDPRVQALAERIIEAQRLEIAEMEALIADLQGGPPATPEVDGE